MFQTLAKDRLEQLNASPSTKPWTYGRVYSALLLVFMVDLFCIVCETLQAILVHGFQLLDIWLHHSACNNSDSGRSKLFDTFAAGSLREWKWSLIRNLGFLLDMATSFTVLALPDATTEELLSYDDECAICREPTAKAKKLKCKHIVPSCVFEIMVRSRIPASNRISKYTEERLDR
ncbi:hypothetical protein K1719_043796 [Acacia pycnantha]|nr:hypothetical protein K1719_043796 [Acacia pycnantha]